MCVDKWYTTVFIQCRLKGAINYRIPVWKAVDTAEPSPLGDLLFYPVANVYSPVVNVEHYGSSCVHHVVVISVALYPGSSAWEGGYKASQAWCVYSAVHSEDYSV